MLGFSLMTSRFFRPVDRFGGGEDHFDTGVVVRIVEDISLCNRVNSDPSSKFASEPHWT